MKKVLLFCLFFFVFSFSASASGNPNIDGGGGGDMGGGSGQNFWNPGYEGIRVTIVDANTANTIATPIDFTNKSPTVQMHFGKVPKVKYLATQLVTPSQSNYVYHNPDIQLPTIISSNSGGISDMDTIRSYFCSEYVLHDIANTAGIDYDDLISGAYKITIEPIAYFTLGGVKWAMTATEAAIYDAKISGGLRAKMVSLSHKNLPLALFLQRADLGVQKYTGSTTAAQSNATIISALGIGIISFQDGEGDEEITPTIADYTYNTDTDVITALRVSSAYAITPSSGRSVNFSINGSTYSKSLVVPPGGEQLVWVKWRTPSTPQTMTIPVGGAVNATLTVNIVDLSENEPPDPKYVASSPPFTLTSTPSGSNVTNRQWSVWNARWIPPVDEDDSGYWYYWQEHYSASLTASYNLTPADRVQTAYNLGLGNWEMKSGYGVEADVEVKVSTAGGVSTQDVTKAQHVVATFSEFGYDTYNRFLEPLSSSAYQTTWNFKQNRYSYYNDRVHFTPLWYPDNTDYIVPVKIFDCWTPAGEMRMYLTDNIAINGSMYDDWYIRLLK